MSAWIAVVVVLAVVVANLLDLPPRKLEIWSLLVCPLEFDAECAQWEAVWVIVVVEEVLGPPELEPEEEHSDHGIHC